MWDRLIEICKKHDASEYFVAECLYAYLSDYCERDEAFLTDLIKFMRE